MSPGQAALLTAVPGFSILVTFFYFALRYRNRVPDPDAAARGGKRLLGLFLRDFWYWLVSPLDGLALRLRWTPDAITLAGLTVTFAAGLAFATGWFGLAGWLVVAGGVLDILDGRVARATGLSRPAGAFLDSTLDRYGDWALFAGLAVYYGSGWGLWMALLTLGGSYNVSYARARAEGLGIRCTDGWLQRAERLMFLATLGIATPVLVWGFGVAYGAPMLAILIFMALLSNLTAVTRMRSIYQRLLDHPSPVS